MHTLYIVCLAGSRSNSDIRTMPVTSSVCETEPFRQSSVLPAQPHAITERLLTFDESYHLGVRRLHHVHSVNLVIEIYKYYNETKCNSSLVNTKTVVFWSDIVQSGKGPCSLNLCVRQSSSFNTPEDDNLRSQQRHQISSLFKQWYQRLMIG